MNSKMERQLNSKSDKQSIYEIFRACRLCGAGGGYKMPIIQSIPLDVDEDVELRQKIRECVQIEVRQNDKMPPLICELCVDKINDFYEFLEMCRQTNKKTRLRLGLPPQTLPRGAPDAEDCILGVTEPVFINEDSNDVPLSKQKAKIKTEKLGNEKNKKMEPSSKLKRKRTPSPEPKVVITRRSMKAETTRPTRQHESGRPLKDAKVGILRDPRIKKSHSPPPKRTTRRQIEEKEESMKLSRLKGPNQPTKQETKPATRQTRFSSNSPKDSAPKGILKVKSEDSFVKPKDLGKRTREKEQQKVIPVKKVKIAIKPVPTTSLRQERRTTATPPKPERRRAVTPPKPERRRTATPPPPAPPARRAGPASKVRRSSPVTPPETHKCNICSSTFVKYGTLISHMRLHTPTHTSNRLACNACREWFTTSEEAAIHHRWHRISSTPYHCELCNSNFRNQNAYNEHFEAESCELFTEVPDLKCDSCWGMYPTQNLMDHHKCPGEDGRPGGKCFKCLRTYATAKTLRKHEESCRAKKKGDIIVSPDIIAGVRKVQIKFARCDPLLEHRYTDDGHYDVSGVDEMYGLSEKCKYPYITSAGKVRVKMELEELDGMVNIKDDLLHLDDGYVHWDSDDSDSSVEEVEASEESKLVPSPFAGGKKTPRVQSLARLSIRSIFSNRFLGKVPKRKRKFTFENLPGDSDFDSITDKNVDLKDEVLNLENKSHEGSLNETDSSKNDDSQTTDKTEEESLVELRKENVCDITESSSEKLDIEHLDDTQKSNKIDRSVENVSDDKEYDATGNYSEKTITVQLDESQKSNISAEEPAEDNESDKAVKVSTENIDTEGRELNDNKVTDLNKDVERPMDVEIHNGNVDGVEVKLEPENKSKANEQNKLDEETLDVDEGMSDMNVKDIKDQKENHETSDTTTSIILDLNEKKSCESLVEHHEYEKKPKDIIEGDTLDSETSSEIKTSNSQIELETESKENDLNKECIENSEEKNECDVPNTTKLEETTCDKKVDNSNDLEISVKSSNKLDSNAEITNNRTEISDISESDNLTPENEKRKSFDINMSNNLDKISDDELNVSDTELDENKLLDELDEQIEERNSGKQSRIEGNSKEGFDNNDKNSEHDKKIFVNEEDSRKDCEDIPEKRFDSSRVVEENNQSDVQNSTDNETSSRSDLINPGEFKTYAVENSDDVENVAEEFIKDRGNSKEVEMTNLEDLTSNLNSLDGLDKCSETITKERENFLLEDKSEHLLNEEDIITSKTDKSMDLDSISDDDFNFDT